jgi:hypothetical protein
METICQIKIIEPTEQNTAAIHVTALFSYFIIISHCGRVVKRKGSSLVLPVLIQETGNEQG